ncbi:putative peptidoglycan-binding domain-containing protein [Rivularia sp. PCC 7116]|uniref:peptidoglycan-binding domain-containing protein n=1 Tax=Rivularia sp. PCC 7116 TaxID=373994 RepID=UPI00029F3F85|nr:peptidoglycan-binding domain-containing protein [Rivularia sp. PCC 7116]AFY56066.1 putative peptidoglycan-binding domain-containing protein [Rivularia sp. PCC 7116]
MEENTSQKLPMILEATAVNRLPTLRFGDRGNSVRILQRLLVAKRYPISVDGDFGVLTETAVKAFQSRRGLRVDGIVGPRTWRALSA